MKRSKTSISTPAKKAKGIGKKTYKKTFFSVPRPLVQYKTGFPKQLTMTHRFVQTGTVLWGTGTSAVSYLPFGVNCLYDPYLAVGGAQPLYFDTMTNIYDHYTVTKSRIKVTLIPNTVTPFVAGITIDDDGSPSYTALSTMAEQPSSVFMTSQRDAQVVTLYKTWDCKAVFGPNPLDNDALQGNAAANPTEIQAFIVWFRPIFTAAENMAFDYLVEITYDTVWNEVKEMTGS